MSTACDERREKLIQSMSLGGGAQRRQDANEQSPFREKLIEKFSARHPHPNSKLIWCCVLGEFTERSTIHAVHLFPYRYGQDAMDAIFGREDPNVAELFSPQNGLLIHEDIEAKLDSGHMVIVPNISDLASESQVDAWHALDVKEYKIRIVNSTDKSMNDPVGLKNLPLRELDGRPLVFLNDYRPRARYLYFLYCMAMARQAWLKKGTEPLKENLGRKYWGTRDPYIKHGQLKEVVKELGEDFEHLMEGAMGGEKTSNTSWKGQWGGKDPPGMTMRRC